MAKVSDFKDIGFGYPDQIVCASDSITHGILGAGTFTYNNCTIRVCDGVADNVEIQAALSALTPGRNAKEIVKLTGSFNISARILIPSYTVLELSEAKLTLDANVDDVMFINSDYASTGNKYIDIIGGYIDGNNAKQGGLNLIYSAGVEPTRVTSVGTHECKYSDGVNYILDKYGAPFTSDGIGTITLHLVYHFNLINITATHGNMSTVELLDCHDGSVTGCSFSFAADDNLGVNHNCSDINITGNRLWNAGVGIVKTTASGVSNFEVEDCCNIVVSGNNIYWTTNPDTGGGSYQGAFLEANTTGLTHNISFVGNTITCYASAAIGDQPRGITIYAGAGQLVTGINVMGNTIRIISDSTNIYGINIEIDRATYVNVNDNILEIARYGIYFSGADSSFVSISNNTISPSYSNASISMTGIWFSVPVSYVNIMNNILSGIGSYCIRFDDGATTVNYVKIQSNKMYGAQRCIYVRTASVISNCVVEDNSLSATSSVWYWQTGGVTTPATGFIVSGNQGYIASGELRTAYGSLTNGVVNAIALAWHNPELQDILVKKVTIEVTQVGGTAGSHLDVGIADDAAGTNRGTEFFDDLLLNSLQTNNSEYAMDGGQQVKPVFCQDNASATDGWVVGQILDANASSLQGKYYIEYMGR